MTKIIIANIDFCFVVNKPFAKELSVTTSCNRGKGACCPYATAGQTEGSDYLV